MRVIRRQLDKDGTSGEMELRAVSNNYPANSLGKSHEAVMYFLENHAIVWQGLEKERILALVSDTKNV